MRSPGGTAVPAPEEVGGRDFDGAAAAARLGEFVARTDADAVGPEVLDRTRRSLLDLLGVAVCGSRSESAEAFRAYVARQGGPAEATALGGDATSAYYAALLGATYAHATELSETFNRAVVHPGNVVFPAALAVAEREHRSGRELLVAASVGYEVLVRAGLAAGGPTWMMSQGFHPPSALGPLGAAAAAANLLRLDVEAAGHAVGAAACSSPSTLTSAFQGATVKELFEGLAAATGVLAADLAAAGVTAPPAWPADFYRAVSTCAEPARLDDRLGSHWHIASGGLRFKLRAVAAMATPTLDAVERLVTGHPIVPEAIRAVVVRSAGRVLIGAERAPSTMVAARASVPFLTAYALVRQRDFLDDPHLVSTLGPEALHDSAVLALAERVELVVDPRIDQEFESGWPPKFAAEVEVTLDRGDGREERLKQYHDSFPATADLGLDQVAEKFHRIAGPVLGRARAEEVVAMVTDIEDLDDVARLTTLVTA